MLMAGITGSTAVGTCAKPKANYDEDDWDDGYDDKYDGAYDY